MTRRPVALFALAVLSPGCVPVTEPVGDIDKAEPDKALVGRWSAKDPEHQWVVDRPEVKGNPNGLMRASYVPKGKGPADVRKGAAVVWFYTAAVGPNTYANVLLVPGDGHPEFADGFGKDGGYAAWAKGKRGYGVVQVKVAGDAVEVLGSSDGGEKLLTAQKFASTGGIFTTPAGWLTKHLEKNGPDGVFAPANDLKFPRVKE